MRLDCSHVALLRNIRERLRSALEPYSVVNPKAYALTAHLVAVGQLDEALKKIDAQTAGADEELDYSRLSTSQRLLLGALLEKAGAMSTSSREGCACETGKPAEVRTIVARYLDGHEILTLHELSHVTKTALKLHEKAAPIVASADTEGGFDASKLDLAELRWLEALYANRRPSKSSGVTCGACEVVRSRPCPGCG